MHGGVLEKEGPLAAGIDCSHSQIEAGDGPSFQVGEEVSQAEVEEASRPEQIVGVEPTFVAVGLEEFQSVAGEPIVRLK